MNDFERRRNKAAAILCLQCGIKNLSQIASIKTVLDHDNPFGAFKEVTIVLKKELSPTQLKDNPKPEDLYQEIRLEGVWDPKEVEDICALCNSVAKRV